MLLGVCDVCLIRVEGVYIPRVQVGPVFPVKLQSQMYLFQPFTQWPPPWQGDFVHEEPWL